MRIDGRGARVLPGVRPRTRGLRLPVSGDPPVKLIGFVGDSGSGKTTLVEQLIGRFTRGGCTVAAIKHAHHGFDIDRPGKDSYRFRAAGAAQVLVASERRWVLMSDEDPSDPAAALARHLARLDPCDLVIVEGFRGQAGIDFIEVRRAAAGGHDEGGARRPAPAGRIAIASDVALPAVDADVGLAMLDLNDVEGIARFIAQRLELPLC